MSLTTQAGEALASTGTAPSAASSPPKTPGPENGGVAPPAATVEVSAAAPAENSTPRVNAPPLAPAAPYMSRTFGAAALAAEGEDIETFARRRARDEANRIHRMRNQIGTPAIIAILAVIVSALLAWRVTIVQHAPQMASLYASIGLPVNLRELVFGEIRTANETRDGVPMLLVEGTIVSKSKSPVGVPRLRFALRNSDKREIYSWTAMPEQSTLAPGARLPFRSRLASPPSARHDVVVRFVTKLEDTEGAR